MEQALRHAAWSRFAWVPAPSVQAMSYFFRIFANWFDTQKIKNDNGAVCQLPTKLYTFGK